MEKSCCFSGHRPEKLVRTEMEVMFGLRRAIEQAIADGFDTFIAGMARGVDMWAAEIVLELGMPLVAAVPCVEFPLHRDASFDEAWRKRYDDILAQAKEVVYVAEGKEVVAAAYERDRWMVDHSERLIAVFDGTPGGTAHTIEYAKQKQVEIVYV